MITASRRDLLRLLSASVAASLVPVKALATPTASTSTLSNGLRVHCAVTSSSYISAALTLRSENIMGPGGLAHILEHTSFTGSAGALTAKQVKDRHKAFLHDANATTAVGVIQWRASFLPRNLQSALDLLAMTSLDQKFDVETVASEARVVLQELYLEKFDVERVIKSSIDAALYGRGHPYARETVDDEIAKASTEPNHLAAELRSYAESVQLPANMDLFLVGNLRPEDVVHTAAQVFARFPFREGPIFAVPPASVTRSHRTLKGRSQQLKRPLSELLIAWNTGVSVAHPDATVLAALGLYLNELVSKELREKSGVAYSPEVSYAPDRCSGIINVKITSSQDPEVVERKVLGVIESLKAHIDADELAYFKDRMEMSRFKSAESNREVLECMIRRIVEGATIEDCDISAVTAAQIQAAAAKYLPAHKGHYVRAVLRGA
jgi:predicted Zn-dependent peptidase